MQRMTRLEPSGDDDSPTYPLRQIVDTAQPQREQPMEPWGNAGRSGPLARRVSHRVSRGRRTAGNVATPPHGMAFEFAWRRRFRSPVHNRPMSSVARESRTWNIRRLPPRFVVGYGTGSQDGSRLTFSLRRLRPPAGPPSVSVSRVRR
jgi:hypothetical protein